MISIWKETLLPGTQVEARSKRPFTLTKRDIRAGERNINRMVAKGRKIPLIWEHLNVEENDPEEWKARYARNTFGWVGGARLSTVDDVAAGVASRPGTLLVRHDVHDESAIEQLRRTGYVSPKIYHDGYLDSQGEVYRGLSVSHVAASPTVCQFWQAPFPKELSDSDAFYLSYLPPEELSDISEIVESCPAQTAWTWDSWLAQLDATDEPQKPEATELSTTETPEGSPVADEAKKPEGGEGDGKNADLKMIIDAIKKAYPNANISSKVSNWGELAIALESQSGGTEPEPEPEPDNDEAPATADAGSPPMLMSTLDKSPDRSKAARAAVKPELDEVRKRIDAAVASRRTNGVKARAWLRVLNHPALELSVTQTGEVTGPRYDAILKELEEVEKKQPGKPESLNLSTVEVAPPPQHGGKSGVDEAAAEMEAIAQRMSVAKPQSK